MPALLNLLYFRIELSKSRLLDLIVGLQDSDLLNQIAVEKSWLSGGSMSMGIIARSNRNPH